MLKEPKKSENGWYWECLSQGHHLNSWTLPYVLWEILYDQEFSYEGKKYYETFDDAMEALKWAKQLYTTVYQED